MARKVKLHQMSDLSGETSEILLDTNIKTELHIIENAGRTIIRLPFGNKFDIIDGTIVIHDLQ